MELWIRTNLSWQGFTLKANFILIDAVDEQEFILGRTFLKKCDILEDLREMEAHNTGSVDGES